MALDSCIGLYKAANIPSNLPRNPRFYEAASARVPNTFVLLPKQPFCSMLTSCFPAALWAVGLTKSKKGFNDEKAVFDQYTRLSVASHGCAGGC